MFGVFLGSVSTLPPSRRLTAAQKQPAASEIWVPLKVAEYLSPAESDRLIPRKTMLGVGRRHLNLHKTLEKTNILI